MRHYPSADKGIYTDIYITYASNRIKRMILTTKKEKKKNFFLKSNINYTAAASKWMKIAPSFNPPVPGVCGKSSDICTHT